MMNGKTHSAVSAESSKLISRHVTAKQLLLLLAFVCSSFFAPQGVGDFTTHAKVMASDPSRYLRSENDTTDINSEQLLRSENEALRLQLQASQQKATKRTDFAFDHNDLDVFEKHGCYPVKHICTTGQDWFYKERKSDTLAYQPSFILRNDLHPRHQIPKEMSVNHSFFYKTDWQRSTDAPTCEMSPTPNHLVVTGQYLQMIMEIYMHVAYGLWEIWNDAAAPWWKETPTSNRTQIYTLTRESFENQKTVLSSSHALLAAWTSNPIQNYLDLHNASAGCQCFERLIFCGFEDADRYDRRREIDMKKRDPTYNSTKLATIPNNSPIKHLRPGGGVWHKKKRPRFGDWKALNAHIRRGAYDLYPNLTADIAAFKKRAILDALEQRHASNKLPTTLQELDQWTMIGFSQRNGRRRWLNLNQTLDYCRDHWLVQHQIVCVEVNLDTPSGSDPQHQVVMHAGLDALIGIHGSQNLHEIWLQDGAYALEILPHLLGPWGDWTQTTTRPTTNGCILTDTNLNSVGYPLNVTSVPNCTSHWKHVEECNDLKFWDSRDFLVPLEAIESFVQKFLILPSGTVTTTPPRSCAEFDGLANLEFVLYNVNCIQEADESHVKKHYYRQRTNFSHIEKRR